ncbi:unnamed protein product, partial [marine sediment metagenome]
GDVCYVLNYRWNTVGVPREAIVTKITNDFRNKVGEERGEDDQ